MYLCPFCCCSSSRHGHLDNFTGTFVYVWVYDCMIMSFSLLLVIGSGRPLFRNFGRMFVFVCALVCVCKCVCTHVKLCVCFFWLCVRVFVRACVCDTNRDFFESLQRIWPHMCVCYHKAIFTSWVIAGLGKIDQFCPCRAVLCRAVSCHAVP